MFGLKIIKKSTYNSLLRSLEREREKADYHIRACTHFVADNADLRKQLNEEMRKNNDLRVTLHEIEESVKHQKQIIEELNAEIARLLPEENNV